MNITKDQLLKIMPFAVKRIDAFVDPLNDAMEEFEINTPLRMQMFIAQVAHESGEFRYMEEIADGSAYEGRKSLGNTEPGDGKKFKGHGPIQITGRNNHHLCSIALYGDDRLLDNPTLITLPIDGCRSAAWFWKTHGCNELADANDFKKTCIIINGGTNGLPSRQLYFNRAREVIT